MTLYDVLYTTKDYISCICIVWFPVEIILRAFDTSGQQTDSTSCFFLGLIAMREEWSGI